MVLYYYATKGDINLGNTCRLSLCIQVLNLINFIRVSPKFLHLAGKMHHIILNRSSTNLKTSIACKQCIGR